MPTRIVIRGLLLPGGMDELDDMIGAQFTSWLLAPFLTWKIKRAHRNGDLATPVDIIGHSLGANAARNMANDLGDHGVPIGLLVMLDPTVKGRAKYGRRFAFQSSDFRAKEIDGAQNISRPDLNHMGLTTDKRIIQFIKDNLS